MSEPITLTGLLAVYGTIISTIALFWNIFRDLLDRPKLKVLARLGRIARNEVTGQHYSVRPDMPIPATQQVYLFVDVTNVGRRPVRWDGWGGKHYKEVGGTDSFLVVPLALPKMLTEGESHTEMSPDLPTDIVNVRQIFVWDASGKNWYVSRRNLKKLKAEVRKQSGPAN